MSKVKVVIGSNFGDEGKGLMTDYFCHQATSQNENCIVVLSNGGAQRGHTVITPEGLRHVFHHFGSGTFVGADSYYCDQYILNPMTFRKEYEGLQELGFTPNIYAHPNCMWSTPFDVILNQIVEDDRGDLRHGSCGMGIWETIVRHLRTKEPHVLPVFITLSDNQQFLYIKAIRDLYFKMRLEETGLVLSEEWTEVMTSDALIYNFLDDVKFMCDHISWAEDNFLEYYDNVVFENGQGLLLDQNNIKYGDNTTPSNTGICNPHHIIRKVFADADVEVCYVTRTYLTRHGAGRFDEECDKSVINASMDDRTNVPNPYQGAIRYGLLNYDELLKRVHSDFASVRGKNYSISLALTHTNEFGHPDISNSCFSHIYLSDNETRNSVKKI